MVHKRIQKLYTLKTAPDGTMFKIQDIGLGWTLFVKEKGSKRWDEIQSAADAKFLYQVMMNQKEFR